MKDKYNLKTKFKRFQILFQQSNSHVHILFFIYYILNDLYVIKINNRFNVIKVIDIGNMETFYETRQVIDLKL